MSSGKQVEQIYERFIYKSRYSRWDYDKERREHWPETIDRYFDFFDERVPETLKKQFQKAKQYVLDLQVMPSMRALWSAGPALARENIAAYNCSYLEINTPKAFSDVLYLLMNGAGVGISVERQVINCLPDLPPKLEKISEIIVVVEDSKMGWAVAVNELIEYLYKGIIPTIDFSLVRPSGAILKTFGGRASGPEPLEKAMKFIANTFLNSQGPKLSSLECHDIVCGIAEAVVVGGVRRSALISLSNLSDLRMRGAKSGNFWDSNPQRELANNSVAYTEKPEMSIFLEEWINLMTSGTGERGIFNREGAKKKIAEIGRRDPDWDFGLNPCAEIFLRSKQFCNLSEVIVRPQDTLNSLQEKVKFATILGILQSTLTDFHFIDEDWKKNCEEERLLGVSLSGIMDHPVLSNEKKPERMEDWLVAMRETAINVAKKWSKALDINMPVAITCTKPSGTVSQRVGCSPGIHARFAPYYIRRVRSTATDAITKYLIEKNVPWKPENGQTIDNFTTAVFEFPIKAPSKKCTFRYDKTALEQLEHWKIVKDSWCEHEPSITVYVRDEEWLQVAAWVRTHWDDMSGISFLPYDSGVYQLAPYQEITEEKYKDLCVDFPSDINFDDLEQFESEDYTQGAQELACSGSASCELF